MVAHFPLFAPSFLASLLEELRTSMWGLLADLCDELEGPYREAAARFRVPAGLLRSVGSALRHEDYSHWRVVGWIEELNDLVYFVDALAQLAAEPDRRGFAEAFLGACQEQFYEHAYVDELFPLGRPDASGLLARLRGLCARLAGRVVQETVLLCPAAACKWVGQSGRRTIAIPWAGGPDFELAWPAGGLALGVDGSVLIPPASVRRRLAHDASGRLLITARALCLCAESERWTAPAPGEPIPRRWRMHHDTDIRAGTGARLSLGPTLVYDAHRVPARVVSSSPALIPRFEAALSVIRSAWPAGADNLLALTSRIVPLKARGVVSFSYRHRPGLSFINCFDRDFLDLIDDLVHENSHHHLNLFLRKAVLTQGDGNQEIFYSPWRRSLRPLRGILHATFTFTMGAILFERLSSRAPRPAHALTEAEVLRARARCFEEIASVRYALDDLDRAAKRRWLTAAGIGLVEELKREVRRTARRIAPYKTQVYRSRYGRELRRHQDELARAAELYRQPPKIK
ncbi:aKG-HExxH-type peptide beta-hydroxylase [Candidatus Nitrospira bockiana]